MDYYFDERAVCVLQTLKNAKFDSWFVGGCVRDTLLGKSSADYDIATCAHPDDVVSLFQRNLELDLTGKKFGCVRVNYTDCWFEITTLRKDINPNGRHSDVIFTNDLKEDASRRDFTMNAIYWDEHQFIDFFNGKDDLFTQRVRFIGNPNIRVQEDYLRILRFFRFSSAYANELDEEGRAACVKHQSGIQYLSGTRVWNEWQKTLFQPNTKKILQAITENDIDITIFGGKLSLLASSIFECNDTLLLTKLLLPTVHSEHLAHRLSLNAQQKRWLKIAENLEIDQDFKELYMQWGNRTKELVWYWACKHKIDSSEIFEQPFWQVSNPVFPIQGKDVLELGCQPGTIVGEYLQSTRKWWKQNNFNPKREECLSYAKSLFNTRKPVAIRKDIT